MSPYYDDPLVTLYLGDCLEVMPELEAESVDAVVTDPPYGLGFMGKHWDHGVPNVDFWREMYRLLKPGGHLLAFGGTRTVHRIATNIEDAGFEIRDMLMHIYASGFPKSLDVSKAIDKAAGVERESRSFTAVDNGNDLMWAQNPKCVKCGRYKGSAAANCHCVDDPPATDDARQWEGWGTALKPAHEPIVMARKPLVGTVAGNVLRYGTGGLNIGATRITSGTDEKVIVRATEQPTEVGMYSPGARPVGEIASANAEGRWPSNILLSDPELFDEPNPGVVGSGASVSSGKMMPTVPNSERTVYGQDAAAGYTTMETDGDSGGYSRFFLIPKAPRQERMVNGQRGTHPTQKPVDLMRHLLKLVTPPGGVALDPFAGSGTTGVAASLEGIRSILIEREVEYAEQAKGRLMATPMGLGLDVPAGTKRPPKTHPDLSKHQPKRRAPSENYTGGWTGTGEPTFAAVFRDALEPGAIEILENLTKPDEEEVA